MRVTPFVRLVTALAASSSLLAALPAAAAAPASAVAGDASVSFPIALPATTVSRLAALSRTAGHGAQRAAAVRALTPPAASQQAVERWAAEHGFRVVASSRWLVEVRGPATGLAQALGTTATTRTVHGRRYVVAAAHPSVPAALRGVAGAAVGLDERPLFRHHTSYGGGDLQAQLDLPVRGGGAGADVTVGTLNLSGWHPADLTEYASGFGLRVPTVQSVVVGSGHVQATAAEDAGGDVGEVALDAEAIAGTAPGATQRMYFGGNSDADYLAILSAMADDAGAGLLQTASTSWGLCETALGSSELANEALVIDRMVAAGATFFAASGDGGSDDCGNGTTAVDWPASETNVVGVGGTSETGDATTGYGAPTAWSLANGSGSGGGCSQVVTTRPTGQPALCGSFRAVPDMAALADPATGYDTYDSVHGWTVTGGTSLAAPLSAAGLAVFLGSQADKHGVGNILTTAYANPGAFTDVTSGSNGAFTAGAGYDRVTGLGVPSWRQLGALVRSVAASPAAAASSSPLFLAPTSWNSLTVPFAADYNGGRVDNAAVSAGTSRSCPSSAPLPVDAGAGTFTLGAGTADGPVAVTLTGHDPVMGCRATTRTVLLDRHAPTAGAVAAYTGTTSPRYTLSWSFADAAPSSGLDTFAVTATDSSTGVVRLNLPSTTTRSATLTASAGHLYVLRVTASDRAGNVSAVRSVSFRAPYDDRSAAFSTGWGRVTSGGDYLGSHAQSAHAGASYTVRFTGKVLTVGVIKSRYGGYADVFVDGVKRARISLYSSTTRYRQPVRLTAFTSSARHTVVVKVVGAHPSGAIGSYVYLDSFTVA